MHFEIQQYVMPRFVILRHECPTDYVRPSHWDLMVEQGGVLRTWAMQSLPVAGATLEVEALADHRLDYLDYEGPVAGDRGSVQRWDAGTYDVEHEETGRLAIRVAGRQLQGIITLARIEADGQRWTLAFEEG